MIVSQYETEIALLLIKLNAAIFNTLAKTHNQICLAMTVFREGDYPRDPKVEEEFKLWETYYHQTMGQVRTLERPPHEVIKEFFDNTKPFLNTLRPYMVS